MSSIVERLTEGIVNRDMRSEGHALLKKWERTGLLEGMGDDRKRNAMARLLENQAKELLREHSQGENKQAPTASLETRSQIDLFSEKEATLKKALEEMDIDDMTPMDALSKLDELKKKHGI